jgi:chromosome segregation ATPase
MGNTLPMTDTNGDLTELEAEERNLSRRRAALHRRIEFAASDADTTPEQIAELKALEMELSRERDRLHEVIANVREVLDLPPVARKVAEGRETWF